MVRRLNALIIGYCLAIPLLAGCVSADEMSSGPASSSPSSNEESIDPPSFGNLIEGSLFHYYSADDDSWANLTIVDIDAQKKGQTTLKVLVELYDDIGVFARHYDYYNRTTLAHVSLEMDGLRVWYDCDVFSVYPIEEKTVDCQLFVGSTPRKSPEEFSKTSYEEEYSGAFGDFDVVYSEWRNLDHNSLERQIWFAPELGFFVKLFWEGAFDEAYGTSELVRIVAPMS
jgi:hypothetical protein